MDVNYEVDKTELCKDCKCISECPLKGNEVVNCELRKVLNGED
jgi:hypothetical protein